VIFEGFTQDTLAFLRELAANNERPWFHANKDRYESQLLEREKLFIAEVGVPLRAMRPHVEAVPRVNGSIFRINRDTRFSRDKTPYKTYSDLWFWEGRERKLSPGFFVSLKADSVTTGAGTYMTEPGRLERLRQGIAAQETGSRLEDLLSELAAAGYEIGEQGYKRVPRGFASDHPRSDLLKYRVVHAYRSEPVPDEFYGPQFTRWCMERFAHLEPLHEWLTSVLK